MHRFLLVAAAPLAALVLPAAPAQAQSFAADPGQLDQFAASPSLHRDFGVSIHRDGKRHDRRRHRGRDAVVVFGGPWASEGWALYNNRSWEPDSFNDWWHDRPDRAYPRWMRNNANCDRMWWGGGVWRCGW